MSVLSPYRTEPRPADPGRQVTIRDQLALRFVNAAGWARTDHLATLLDTSNDVVRRRIRILRDFRLINFWVAHMHEPNWVSVAPGARPVLARAFGLEENDVYCPRSLPASERLVHHELCVHVHACLAAATARAKPELALTFEHERALRAQLGAGQAGAQVPDGIAVLNGDAQHAVALEADTGSESPLVVLKKIRLYAENRGAGARLHGTPDWDVAFVVDSERRRNRLALACGNAGFALPWLHFAVRSALTGRNILGPVWRRVEIDARASEVRLVPSNPFRPVLSDRLDGQDARVRP